MRILGIDLETTGIDTANDRIIEIGTVLWEAEEKRVIDVKSQIFHGPDYPPIKSEIEEIVGLKEHEVKEFGVDIVPFLDSLNSYLSASKVDYICAHNGENFDKPMLVAAYHRAGLKCELENIPWIDTRHDLPFAKEPDSKKLKHLALDLGFINPLAHRALVDTLTMMKVLSYFDINEVINYSKIPFVVVRADVSYDDRDKAKLRRYSWERIGEEYFPKSWVKKIKETELNKEKNEAPFRVIQIK